MITPGALDLVSQRWTPFAYTITIEGVDLTGATMTAHIRLYRDAPGDPIMALATTVAPAEGISVSAATTLGVPTSTIAIRVNETTLEAILLNAGKPGDDVRLVWDMHVTGGGFPKTRFFEGAFIIRAGATQNG